MKAVLLVAALVAFGGLAAHASHVQPHQAKARALVVPPAPRSNPVSASAPRQGSIGGPVHRLAGIDATALTRKLSRK